MFAALEEPVDSESPGRREGRETGKPFCFFRPPAGGAGVFFLALVPCLSFSERSPLLSAEVPAL